MSISEKEKEPRIKSKIKIILGGLQVGFGSIIPGVSGAVMAVSLGLYRPMIDAVAGLTGDFKNSFRFLWPLGIGISCGLIIGAVLLDWLLASYLVPLLYQFIGLICGGVPALIKEANQGGFRQHYILAAIGGAAIASLLLLLDQAGLAGTDLAGELSTIQAMIAGAIIAAGAIIPGISTSFILIYLGWYPTVIAAFSQLDIETIFFIALGVVICGVLIIKLVRWLFDRFPGSSYYCVLGFLLVSIVLIWPPLTGGASQILWMLLIIPGFLIAYLFSRKAINN